MTSAQQEQGPSVIERLADYAGAESFEALPETVVRAAGRAILDTLAVTLAGSQEETAVRVRNLIAPCCASTHQALDATLDLIEMHRLEPGAVAAVECAVHYLAPHQLIYDRAETGDYRGGSPCRTAWRWRSSTGQSGSPSSPTSASAGPTSRR